MRQKINSSNLLNLLKQQYPVRCSETAPIAYWKMKALIAALPQWIGFHARKEID